MEGHLGRAAWFLAAIGIAGCADVPSLVVNELMARNTTAVADEQGEYDDWIEVWNGSGRDVDLGGFFVSDNPEDPFRVELPEGLVVPAAGLLLLWCDDAPEQGPRHLPFRLRGNGEMVSLTSPEGDLLDSVEFDDVPEDQVLARYPDGEGELMQCGTATPGSSNGGSCE